MPYPAAMGRRRRSRRTLLAAVACAIAGHRAVPCEAQPAALREVPLVVQRAPAAADCPDAAALAERVNELVGRKALVPSLADAGNGFTFDVQILKSDEGFTAIVLAAGRSRQLGDPGPKCGSLSEALALTLAILVDADDVPAPAAPPPPAPKPAPAPVFVPPPKALPAAPKSEPRVLISPVFGVAGGLVGTAIPALSILGEVRIAGPLSLLAGFTWTPNQSFDVATYRVDVQLMYGQIAACLSTWHVLGSSRLGGCFQFDAGGIRGKSSGFELAKEVVRPWTSLALTGLLDVPIVGPLHWSSRLSGFLVVPQEAFAIDQVGVAFDPPPVGIFVGTGASLRF